MDRLISAFGGGAADGQDGGLQTAVRWVTRLGLGKKLLLALLMVIAAVAAPLYQQFRLSQGLIVTAEREREGARLAGELLALQRDAQAGAARAALDARMQTVQQHLQTAIDERWPERVRAVAAEARKALDALLRAEPESAPVFDAALLELLDHVVDHSGLSLDPHADTYFLIQGGVLQAAALTARLREPAALGPDLLQQGQALEKAIGKALASDVALRDRLAPPLATLMDAMRALASGGGAAQSAKAQAELADLSERAVRQLRQRLDDRARGLRMNRYQLLLLVVLLLSGVGALSMLIVREFRQKSRDIAHRAELLGHAEELAQIGCAETDLISDETRWTPGMYRLFGEVPGEGQLDPDWLYERVPRGERDLVRASCHAVGAEAPAEFQHRIVQSDGSLRTVLHRVIVDVDEHGWPRRALTILQDVTRQRDAERRIDALANSCPITGLPNRKALIDKLGAALERLQGGDCGLIVMLVQIEQLGIVMDSLGYEGGDKLLQQAAKRLAQEVDQRGVLAHLGSGEFAVAVECSDAGHIDDERLLAAARPFAETLWQRPVQLGDAEIQLSCAVGVTCAPRDGDQAQKLLHQAQAALKRAHELGDKQVCLFDPATHARMVSRLGMEAGMRRALEQGGFSLHFQPQMDLTTGLLCSAEVLLRWHDPVRGDVSPVEFIPVAEECGLIVELGEWVLRAACALSVRWRGEGLAPVRLSVNLSSRQLQEPDIAWRIQRILQETGMDPKYLGLEITESIFIDESSHVERALRSLKSLGIEITLDDFGTGYSNLGYLRKLPIDVVKIDRSIVHDVAAAAHDVSMTRAVINMAHSLQMKVLAEGVETEGQLALLMANRCDQMQGFFFSAAVPADQFAALVRAGRRLPEHLFQRERKRTLLLVDDEENILSALKRLLRRDGYQIITANSGAEGLQRLAEHEVDVIVSDQRMPGMTGVEFLQRAKELYPSTVRIVLSGYTELQSITDAVNEGAIYKFLTKPWDDERLRGHVSEAFRSKELSDENARLTGAITEANHELAQVNKRLQALSESQRERITREEISLQVVRDLLENIPVPVIGGDRDGMISYVNAQAERLFGETISPLGLHVDEALPASLVALWRRGPEALAKVAWAGQDFQAVCRTVGPRHGEDAERGKLLVLMPVNTCAEEI